MTFINVFEILNVSKVVRWSIFFWKLLVYYKLIPWLLFYRWTVLYFWRAKEFFKQSTCIFAPFPKVGGHMYWIDMETDRRSLWQTSNSKYHFFKQLLQTIRFCDKYIFEFVNRKLRMFMPNISSVSLRIYLCQSVIWALWGVWSPSPRIWWRYRQTLAIN